jgi:dienelactone hydrolase
MKRFPTFLFGLAITLGNVAAAAADPAHLRVQITALGDLKSPPAVHAAEGFAAEGTVKPLFFEGLPYRGKPTRVFAWLGLPAAKSPAEKVPGVVLVHGGGGTAFKEWVQKWNAQGFAAIAMAVEGQTDVRIPGAPAGAQWQRHALGGPARNGIYGDAAEPLADQWMFHAVADVILAHSLLRSQPAVDAARVGVCGISWGGIITSTVVGIDSRFAFGIPIYGCGALDRAPNHYGKALGNLALYREVWDPVLRLPRATMPLLWFTGPSDAHFPLEFQQASYRAAPGPRLVSVPFGMKHGHGAGWNPPDSYAFAKAVVATGRPWAREVSRDFVAGSARVIFEVVPAVDAGILVFRRGADWEQAPARVETSSGRVTASATVPAGTTAYFFNLAAGGLTLSSELETVPLRPASP